MLRSSSPSRRLILSFVLVCSVVAVYSNSLQGAFFFDDLDAVVRNHTIRTLSVQALQPPSDGSPVSGRPLVNLSFALNYALGGLEVLGYHVFNITLHALAALVLFALLGRVLVRTIPDTMERIALAAGVTLLWALHPLHTESVNYVSQRTTLMMGLFYLSALYGAVRHLEQRQPSNHIWAMVAVSSAGLSMLSKETAVTLPVVVLLTFRYGMTESWGEVLKRYRFFLVLSSSWILLGLMMLTSPRAESAGLSVGMSVLDYLRTSANVILHYYRLSIWPDPLVVDYHGWPIATTFRMALPGLALIVPLLAASVLGFWRGRPWMVFAFLPLVLLSPSSSFVPILTEVAAERRMYLPLVPLALAVGIGLWHGLSRLRFRLQLTASLLVLLAAAGSVASHVRNRQYRTDIAIWSDTVAKRPDNVRAQNNLGFVYSQRGQLGKAMECYRKALSTNPGYGKARRNLALAHRDRGNFGLAKQELERAIQLVPKDPENYFALAELLTTRQPAAAHGLLKKAHSIDPNHVPTIMRLAVNYAAMRQPAAARHMLRRGLRLAPEDPRVLFTAGAVLLRLGDAWRAIRMVRQGLTLRAELAPPYLTLALAHIQLGQRDKARIALKRALRIAPGSSQAKKLLSLIDTPSP